MPDERAEGGGGIEERLRTAREASAPQDQLERLESGTAWEDFCDALRSAGREILRDDAPAGERNLAEGHRYLLGLLISGVQQATSLSDPLLPTFIRNPDSTSKWGAENADNQYLWTRISPNERYRITGRTGSAYEILFEVKEGYMQLGDARNFATLDRAQLNTDPQAGRFEIELGGDAPSQPGANWLPIDGDARYLAIRVYYYDWDGEDLAEFEIVRVGGEGRAPAPLDAAGVAHMLDSAGDWVGASTDVWSQWVRQIRDAHQPGELGAARSYVGGADDIYYGNDLFRLAPDEAMILETELPDARYWSFQLGNLWFHSLDFANRQTSLNGRQAQLDSDGRLRIVVAHEDPGVPNWLDTTGHEEGLLQYRWIWTRDNPQPSVRIVKFDELREQLPADTPRVDPSQRRATIAARQRHMRRREPWS
jgi:hypothetical protein